MRLFGSILLLLIMGGPAHTKEYWNYDTAIQAYESGEILLGADMFRRLAQKGDRRAQNDLAFLYLTGQGVEKNYRVAAKWFRAAADRGHMTAMFHLAEMYDAGWGVAKSTVVAYKFYYLVSHLTQNDDQRDVTQGRIQKVRSRLSASQIKSAKVQACEWWFSHKNAWQEPVEKLPICAAK